MRIYQTIPSSADSSVIRLLEFRSPNNSEIVEASIATYDLQDEPDYNALSYAWGATDLSAHLVLNDEVFAISKNLFAALQQISQHQRNTGRSRKLWVDAICINQSDNAEKSHQVLLMRDIYFKADTVLAWIGVPDQYSALAFNTLRRFAIDDGTSDGSVICQQLQDTLLERQTAIQIFLDRGYFIRMWIVQEVVVANRVTVLCGALEMGFDKIGLALQRMTGSGFYRFSPMVANLSYIYGWRTSFQERRAPDRGEFLDLRLFIDSQNREAADPRDKIYSLRGIINPTIGSRININYDDPVEKVYTNFAKMVLSTRSDLQILSAVILHNKQISKMELPSYVPDWSLPSYEGGILQRYFRFKQTHLFRAAGSSKTRVTLIEDSNQIGIEGSRLDTVSRVIPINNLLHFQPDGPRFIDESILRNLAASIVSLANYPFTQEPSWIALFRTLTADRTALSPRIDELYWSRYFANFSFVGIHHASGVTTDLPSSAWALVSSYIGIIIQYKDMFLTTRGYLGLAQIGFEVGDIVTILSGGEVPFILRKIDGRENKDVFRFLCECYVHGVMDGEVADDLDRSLEDFQIV